MLRELGRELVALLVVLEQALDRVGRDGPYRIHELADAVAVHGEAEPQLCLDLVALRDRDVAHVVAEPRDREPLRLVPAAGCPCPPGDPLDEDRILPVPGDGLPAPGHASLEESVLAVAVGRLVQIHEIHVDLRPRELAVELCVEVQERLLQGGEPGDPHPCRRERVHPDDEAGTRIRAVRLEAERADRLGGRHDRLVDDTNRHRRRGIERRRNLRRMHVDPGDRLLPVEVLAARDEPELEAVERLPGQAPLSSRVAPVCGSKK